MRWKPTGTNKNNCVISPPPPLAPTILPLLQYHCLTGTLKPNHVDVFLLQAICTILFEITETHIQEAGTKVTHLTKAEPEIRN